MVRVWDRRLAQFVEVPVQRTLDNDLACKDCRYFDEKSHICQGAGSQFYQKRVPHQNFIIGGTFANDHASKGTILLA